MPDYDPDHNEDEGQPIPESLRRELTNWSLGFNNEGPPRWSPVSSDPDNP